jgi:hypothetical protein
MYGGDEHSTSSTSIQNQIPQSREVNVDEPRSSKTKKKIKDPAPIINITKPIDTTKEFEIDSVFGLSTIKETHDQDDTHRHLTDDELDFDNYFNKLKQPIEQKKTKKPAPIIQSSKEPRHSTVSHSDEIRTPATSISLQTNPLYMTISNVTKKPSSSENKHDSTDDDVDELIGNLEVRFFGKYTHTYIHTHHSSPIELSLFK